MKPTEESFFAALALVVGFALVLAVYLLAEAVGR